MGKKDDARTFLISVAAELAGMHAQTLRTYDRLGLVSPRRSSGGGRRYSQHDVELLREVQRLSQDEGVNLAGIKRIIELTNQVEALQSRLTEMAAEIEVLRANQRRDVAVVPRALQWWSGNRAANAQPRGSAPVRTLRETQVVDYSCFRVTIGLTLVAKDFPALGKHAEMFDPPNYSDYDRWLNVFFEASVRLDALEKKEEK